MNCLPLSCHYLGFTAIFLALVSAPFGTVIVMTPLSASAETLSASVPGGSAMLRLPNLLGKSSFCKQSAGRRRRSKKRRVVDFVTVHRVREILRQHDRRQVSFDQRSE